MARRPHLRALARRLGILDEYIDITGRERRRTTDETRVALLADMGFDASEEAAAARSLEILDHRARERLLDPVQVVRQGDRRPPAVTLRSEGRPSQPIEWSMELREESGETHRAEGSTLQARRGALRIPLPRRPDPGYHTLRVRVTTPQGAREAEQVLIVAPRTCFTPKEALGGRRAFGVWTNLYTLRSRRNWGVGDLKDLERLIEWAGGRGAAFVGLNPLHAARNRDGDVSPYSPVSRLYRNPIYLDAAEVPEARHCPEAGGRMNAHGFREEIERLREADHIDYGRIMAAKRPLLKALHRVFAERHRGRRTDRGRRYAQYLEREEDPLTDFATFLALEEHFGGEGRRAGNWRAWPSPYRDPRSPEVRAFRLRRAEEVDFHRYLQFEMDRQLSRASERARAAGMPVGLYLDLAIGAAPGGSDAWAFQGLFLEGVTLGAPPDDYSHLGQNWSLPPIDPQRLIEDRYRYWILLLRAALAHAGALRIDHVIGIFRQFWIPRGRLPTEGAYVRPPTQDLLGILALESRRHRALVVGEDLGTVPRGLPAALAKWGILSCRLLYFERTRRGAFKPAARISGRAAVTVNNHDLPPLAGYWKGTDLRLRREIGQIPDEASLQEEEKSREKWRGALLRRLRSEGVLSAAAEPEDAPTLCAAVHAYLCRAPSPLVGLSLDDLAGETDPVNIPGVGPDRYKGWSRRMRLSLDDLPDHPAVRRGLEGARERMGKRESN